MLCETKSTTERFFGKVLSTLARRVYQLDFETAARLVNANLRTLRHELLHEKLLERLLEVDLADDELPHVDFKLLSYLVWSLCDAKDKEEVLPIFARYELLVDIKPLLSIREASYLLWAVTLKYKISVQTFRKLADSLVNRLESIYSQKLEQLLGLSDYSDLTRLLSNPTEVGDQDKFEEDMGTWDIMNIMWGLSKFQAPEVDWLIKLFCPFVNERLQFFSAVELVMIFRVLTEKDYLNSSAKFNAKFNEGEKPHDSTSLSESSKEFYLKIIDQLVTVSPQMEDSQILVIMYQLVNCPHLKFTDHTARLKKLFEVREDLMKKIELQKDKIEESIDIEELEQKRDLAHGKISRSSTRSNLINKPF